MSETMILTLEGRFEDYLGKEVQVEHVKEISNLALKHGLRYQNS